MPTAISENKLQSLLGRFLLNISISAIESPKEYNGDSVHYIGLPIYIMR